MMREALLCLVLLASCSRTDLPVRVRCGDGIVDPGEECDDGNRIDHDGCSNRCRERVCGNGVVEAPEECDLGAANEDRPALELLHAVLPRGRRPIMPVDEARTVVDFYDYRSESSHTGFEGRDLSALFLYRDTQSEVLSLVNHHGIDEDTTGITLPHGLVATDWTGVPPGVAITVGDEAQEFFFFAEDEIHGRFEFWRNTDGGALSELPFPGDWQIDVTVTFELGITTWHFFDADRSAIVLDEALVASIVAHSTPSRCRTDCVVPRCGDGFVDGGEVCDDGNVADGDGCAADCRSLGGP